MATADVRLNHTIYINNLNEKIKKDGEAYDFEIFLLKNAHTTQPK